MVFKLYYYLVDQIFIHNPWSMETFITYVIYFGMLLLGVLISYCAFKDSTGCSQNACSYKEQADEFDSTKAE